MKYVYIIIALCMLLIACDREDSAAPAAEAEVSVAELQAQFFDNLSSLCGEWLSGGSTYPDDSAHPLVDTQLRNHVSECDDRKVRIELFRDGDYWHGAWVVEKREEGLHLFHDHLGEVRTMEDLGENDSHGYGGYADERGTATTQYFAADDVTAEMIPAAETNVWMMDMDLENGQFIYYLERHSEPRFRAVMTIDG